jgi:REP element-mobilizing transposase RayT
MSTARQQEQERKGSDAQRSASQRKARGSHCPQGKGDRRRSKPASSKLTITNPDAAGIDIGARVHYVAVPEGRDKVLVRSFGAYTAQLDELAQWLKDCAIKTVAMESTGVYWISLYQKLEEAGLEVLLVDAHQAKHVPGRKSDVQIANGCSSCTVTVCCERRFVLKTPFAAYAACNDIARAWATTRRCGFSTSRRLSMR